ncbi:hypothetical protein L596_017842 [Steinernema carpocapsae]|uniref:Hpc2-related domain-containing protein n=1 Tax=Steinernema carpocapsae TaxID=34508 RepID=A0A4U5N3A3_STECR|nr:hypothetical protein L596_017842 [Steinernema carpocapsae]
MTRIASGIAWYQLFKTTAMDILLKKKKKVANEAGLEVTLDLFKPTRTSFPRFDFTEIKKTAEYKDGLSDHEDERFHDSDAEALFRRLEAQYSNKRDKNGKRKNLGIADDYIDKGLGYDLEDDFIDDSETYDILIPSTMEPEKKGFYVNKDKLHFRSKNEDYISDTEEEEEVEVKKPRKVKSPVEASNPGPSTSSTVPAKPAASANGAAPPRLSAGAAPNARMSAGAPPTMRMSAGQPPSKKSMLQRSVPRPPPAKAVVHHEPEPMEMVSEDDDGKEHSQDGIETSKSANHSEELEKRIRAFKDSVEKGKARQRLSIDQVKLVQKVEEQASVELRPHAKSRAMEDLAVYAGLSKVTLNKLLQKHANALQASSASPSPPATESPSASSPVPAKTSESPSEPSKAKTIPSTSKTTSTSPSSHTKPTSPASSTSSAAHPLNPNLLKAALKNKAQQAQFKPSTSGTSAQPSLKPSSSQATPKPSTPKSTPKASTSQKTPLSKLDVFKAAVEGIRSKQKNWAPEVSKQKMTDQIVGVIQCDKIQASMIADRMLGGGKDAEIIMAGLIQHIKNLPELKTKDPEKGKTSPLTSKKSENVHSTAYNAENPAVKKTSPSLPGPPKLTRMEPEMITIDDDEIQILS